MRATSYAIKYIINFCKGNDYESYMWWAMMNGYPLVTKETYRFLLVEYRR